MSKAQHWKSFAHLWDQLGAPLRPGPEDQANYEKFFRDWLGQFPQSKAVILGVTPELFHLRWPAKCELLALDRAREMIDEVWPGSREQVIEGDWLEMPVRGPRQLSLCDGGLMLLEYPRVQEQLRDRLERLIGPGGRSIFRLFALPEMRETHEVVLEELVRGKIPNLNVLKLRLGMALQANPEEGVAVREILRAVESVDSDLLRLAQRLGWKPEQMQAIEAYRNSGAVYYFPTERQTIELFCASGAFDFLGRATGHYPLAERCPVVAFKRS